MFPLKSNVFKFGSKIFQSQKIKIMHQRNLNVQEFISYKLLNDAGIPTPKFYVAENVNEAKQFAEKLNTNNLIVKAQVLAGGRGKGYFKNGFRGGVKLANSPQEVQRISEKMLGNILITKQTGAMGKQCNKIMIAERKFARREFYFAVMMEPIFGGPVLIASTDGGIDIEEVAAVNPSAIFYEKINIINGLTCEQICKVINAIGLSEVANKLTPIILNMYKLFVEKDAVLIEINPLAEDLNGNYFALDAKFRFDDDAAFRQKELFAMKDLSQEDPKELAASKLNLNYISLDGSIGCLVNGAGLAMATMDIIKLHGGYPANFLDVGGGATVESITEAFRIILADPNVNVIFVNIFGGIMRCDIIAMGIIKATETLKITTPIVVRLLGTNLKEAKQLIKQSKLKIMIKDDFSEAAEMTVHLAEIVQLSHKIGVDIEFKFSAYDKKN